MTDVPIASDDSNISGVNFTNQSSAPSSPATGHTIVYIRSGVLYQKGADGVEHAVGAVLALPENNIFVGDASDLADALAPGTDGQVLTVQADGSLAWETPAAASGGGFTEIAIHTVPAGGEASYTFSNIPATYTHLRLELALRTDQAGVLAGDVYLQFNGDTGNNYTSSYRYGVSTVGEGTVVGNGAAQAVIGRATAAVALAGAFAYLRLMVPFYHVTGLLRAFHAEGAWPAAIASANVGNQRGAGLWNNNAAITSITLLNASTYKFVEGSILRLLGHP